MKNKDLLIVSQLRENSRTPVKCIGKAIKMCRATVAERLKLLQKRVIKKYTCLVDFSELGYVRLLFSISLHSKDKDVFRRYIQGHSLLNNLFETGDGSDYFVEMIFSDKTEAEDFISSLQRGFNPLELHFFFVQQDIVREYFLQNWVEA